MQALSAFLGQPASKAAPAIDFISPLTEEEQRSSLEFFKVLSFTLRFCPAHPTERELMARLARIGVGAGKAFEAEKLPPEMQTAIEQGMSDAWADFEGLVRKVNAGEVNSGDATGTREHLKNNYLYRMGAAAIAIYGNSQQEAMYPKYNVDSDGQKLDASVSRYILRFAPS